jgi:hypothetical protein
MTVLLDPTSERRPVHRPAATRPASLEGVTVALLDISKPKGDIFLDRVAEHLARTGIAVRRFTKPTFTKPAPVDLRQQIATTCGAVIEALAD